MKKIFFSILVLFTCIASHAQFGALGISLYPYPSAIGFRWAGIQRSSWPGEQDRTTTNYAIELRTAFNFSFSGEGNVSMIQPELNATFCLANRSNVNFLSGLGLAFGYQSDNDNFFGAYIPLAIEFYPQIFNGFFSVKGESDFFFKKYPDFSTFSLRPMVGLTYNFINEDKTKDVQY
jgi:hypothetical protein